MHCSADDPWSCRMLRRVVPVDLVNDRECSADIGGTQVQIAVG